MRPNRVNMILVAAAVGIVTIAGLVVHGVVGGVLLILVAAALVALSFGAGSHVRREGRMLRMLIVAALVVLAILKFAGTL